MNLSEFLEEVTPAESAGTEQNDYEVLMNIGDEIGDHIVRVGAIEWQHNERRIIIQANSDDVLGD